MTDLGTSVAVAAVVGLWVAIGARLVMRYHRLTHFDALLAVFAAGATVDTLSALNRGLIGAGPAHAVLIASSLAGLLIAVEAARVVIAAAPEPVSGLWVWPSVTATVIAVLWAAVWLGAPAGPIAVASWHSATWQVLFWGGYAGFQISACVVLVILLRRFVATVGPGPLRQVTLFLLLVVVAAGVVYGVALAALAADGAGWSNEWGAAGYTYGSVQYILLVAAYVRVRWARRTRRGTESQLLDQLEPLWHQLRPVCPEFTLAGWLGPASVLGRAELSMACVRVGVEIRGTGSARLASSSPAATRSHEVAARAAADLSAPGADHDLVAAVAVAGWIRAGLLVGDDQVQPSHSVAPTPGVTSMRTFGVLAQVAAVDNEVAEEVAGRVLATMPSTQSQSGEVGE